jgi:penicillin-binding protein 1A
VYTTFDKNLQTLAQNATEQALPRSPSGPDWMSSLVAIDPATGAVKAMVGGRSFSASQYNIATHEPGRQPGSTWKTITLATALANGYSPNDYVDGNAPCSVPSKFGAFTTTNSEGGGGGYETIWNATAESVNCAFVRLSTSVGQDRVMEMAHKLGITQQKLFPHLTLSIGDIEATPLEMATVIATIANDGVHQTPYVVQNIVGADGISLKGFPQSSQGDKVLDPDVAECEQLVLRGVITNGTGSGYTDVPGHQPFGKTGTTDNLSDAWFVGGTPQIATAVWFGNSKTNQLRAGFGGPTAGPIWRQFMRGALEGLPNLPLPNRGSNAVCNRSFKVVNEAGGRAALELPLFPDVQTEDPTGTKKPGKGGPVITVVPTTTTTTSPGPPGKNH